MTSPRTAAKRDKDNRLFAGLLALEHGERALNGDGDAYLAFIRAQATYTKSSRGWCYALALREITHG